MFNNKKETKTTQVIPTDARSIIGKGTTITGNIDTVGNIRIDGKLKGDLKCEAKVALGEGSEVEGDIVAQNAEIEGKVVGILRISEVLILKPTAVITGDIFTTRLIVEAGAVFNGTCKMGETIEKPHQKSQTPKASA